MEGTILNWILKGLKSLSVSLTEVMAEMVAEMSDDGSTSAAGESAGESVGTSMIDGLIKWLQDNWPLIMETFTLLFVEIMPLISQLVLQLGTVVAIYLYNAAITAGRNFVIGLMLWILQLPGKVMTSLALTLIQVNLWAAQMVNRAKLMAMSFVASIISYIQQLPGRVWAYLLRAIGYIASFASRAYTNAKVAGMRIVTAITATISSLPGRMYSWGSHLISNFVSGITSQFPNVLAALNWIKAHLPSSPPKMGPLSETTAKGWYDWTSSLVAAGMKGFDNFDIGSLNMPSVGVGFLVLVLVTL
jgi:hypothetical protein